jgi:hypothetical protein
MPKKPKPKPGDPEQSKPLVKTAGEISADRGREEFERAFKKMFPRDYPSAKRKKAPQRTGA